MSGTKGHSGGANRLSIAEHLERGTLRPHRHLQPIPAPLPPLSVADRRRTLKGLPPTAHRIARGLLDTFDGWQIASLETLRAYSLSCARLELLQDTPTPGAEIYRELRANLSLLTALNLEATR